MVAHHRKATGWFLAKELSMTRSELLKKLDRLAEDSEYVSTIVSVRPDDASELMKDLARRLREVKAALPDPIL
jgi:hypothetical protein